MATPVSVLIVEDSETDAELILRELRRQGFAPRSARVDSGPALQTALSTAEWDVIISDNNMPGFSGDEALKMAKTHAPDVPFIVVSGTRSEDEAVDAMRAGASDFIVKGRLQRLALVIERELRESANRRERRRTQDPPVTSQENHHSHELAAAERLASGVAHDFSNTVAVILSHATLVLNRLPADSPHRAEIESIQQAGHRATELTRQLIAFSRQHLAGSSERVRGNGERILVIDLEPFNRELSAQVLSEAGYRVTSAAGPDQALAILKSETTPFALVIAPLGMSPSTGRTLVEQSRSANPNVRVLFVTDSTVGPIDRLGLFECDDMLMKPFAPEELITRVRTTLDTIKH